MTHPRPFPLVSQAGEQYPARAAFASASDLNASPHSTHSKLSNDGIPERTVRPGKCVVATEEKRQVPRATTVGQ
jgi:hypothetical protein